MAGMRLGTLQERGLVSGRCKLCSSFELLQEQPQILGYASMQGGGLAWEGSASQAPRPFQCSGCDLEVGRRCAYTCSLDDVDPR